MLDKRRWGMFLCTVCLVLLILLVTVLTACITLLPPLRSPPPNFKVAFIGDQGVNSNAVAVLQLIKSEGADMGARLTFTIHRQALLADQAVGEDTDCDAQADGYLIGGAIGTASLTANGILWRSRQDEPHL